MWAHSTNRTCWLATPKTCRVAVPCCWRAAAFRLLNAKTNNTNVSFTMDIYSLACIFSFINCISYRAIHRRRRHQCHIIPIVSNHDAHSFPNQPDSSKAGCYTNMPNSKEWMCEFLGTFVPQPAWFIQSWSVHWICLLISLLISHKFLITGSYTRREHEDISP